MTTPTVTEPQCNVCGRPIEPAGWPSWRHVGLPGGQPHPATPDQHTRRQTMEVAA